MTRETFRRRRTNEGDLDLSKSSYGESGVHVSRGVDHWANANVSAFDRIVRKHDQRTGARHETDLRGPPGTELYTSHRAPGARDDIIITTEFDSRGRSLSWAAFTSEF